MTAREALGPYDVVIVLSGDAPLITSSTIEKLRDFHLSRKAAMTLLTTRMDNPTGYGRIIRKSAKKEEVQAIVEQNSLAEAQKTIREVNAGFYAFSMTPLLRNIEKLGSNNPHRELYLTDMAEILSKNKGRVEAIETSDAYEVLGGNTRAELVDIDQRIRTAKYQQLMAGGVTIFYPQTCIIDSDVEISADTTIEPFVQILGATRIGSDCRIRSYSVISNSKIGDGVLVRPGCVIDGAHIDKGAVIGPYSHLRPGSEIGEGAHVGNFVETKNIQLGRG